MEKVFVVILIVLATWFAIAVPVVILRRLFGRTVIRDYEVGVAIRRGRIEGKLATGVHWAFKPWTEIRVFDARKKLAFVTGQEVLTRENVGVKVSVSTDYRIADALRAVSEVENHEQALHNAVQLAVRGMVGAVDADALVGKRVDFARELLATLRPEAETFGVAVERVDVRDIMFPGELKRAFQEVIRAQKEGQAALERARAESATTRSLANTARAIEANPALMQLRLLQSMNEISSRGGNTFAFGIPEGAFGRANGKEK